MTWRPILASIAVLASCASTEVPGAIDAIDVPWHTEAFDAEPSFKIAPGDELEIRFAHVPELDATMPVRPDGLISLPLAEGLRAAGKTPEQLAREIESSYQSELIDPRVAVIVRGVEGQRVTVSGAVDEPGSIVMTGPTTILEALSMAGGVLETGNMEQIILLRRRASSLAKASVVSNGPDDERVYSDISFIVVDLRALFARADERQNLYLQPRDIVFVPRTRIANVNLWVDQYLRQNLPFDINFGVRVDDLTTIDD